MTAVIVLQLSSSSLWAHHLPYVTNQTHPLCHAHGKQLWENFLSNPTLITTDFVRI